MKPVIEIESELRQELADVTPGRCPELLSKAEKDRAIERSFHGLYRWYFDRSQATRSWSPDRSFEWGAMRQDHDDELLRILEGFFAVEQYNPDFTSGIVNIVRKSYGRGSFQVRWGVEEERHSDLWRNTLFFCGRRSPQWLEEYVDLLRGSTKWVVPWDEPVHMLLYQVIQERATQLNYLNFAQIARGTHASKTLSNAVDPVLAEASRVIAIDEAAHYNFFLEGARLFFYYYPEETAQALLDVIRHYTMPGREIVPDYGGFATALKLAGIFDVRSHYVVETLQVILDNLGISNLTALDEGIKKSREVPDTQAAMRETTLFESLDYGKIEESVKSLARKIGAYEDEVGISRIRRTEFLGNPTVPGRNIP